MLEEAQQIVTSYNAGMESSLASKYWQDTDFYNLGYWTRDTHTQGEASENLVEKLLSFIPEKRGRILDVACGLGASTRCLRKYYEPANVTAINISSDQLTRARENAPGCGFSMMDAARLAVPDNTFDNVICVEAAFHFDTREQFYKEAFRVLKPGGRLVTADILFGPRFHKHVPANYVEGPEALRLKLTGVGFQDAMVIDTTDECWGGFARNLRRWPLPAWRAGTISLKELSFLYLGVIVSPIVKMSARNYVLTSAVKPPAGGLV